MGVGATDTKGTDASPAGTVLWFPRSQSGIHVKRAVHKIDIRVGRRKMQAGRQLFMPQGQNGFYESSDTRRSIKMSHVSFDRANCAYVMSLYSSRAESF